MTKSTFQIFSKNPLYTNIRATNKHVVDRFLSLPQDTEQIQATYIWIDGSGKNLRSKTMTINTEPSYCNDLPWWNFDGSSTNQAYGHNSDVYLKPIGIFKDPFTMCKNKLVLCETYTFDKNPTGILPGIFLMEFF
jgi:glutamine synthetase